MEENIFHLLPQGIAAIFTEKSGVAPLRGSFGCCINETMPFDIGGKYGTIRNRWTIP